MDEELRKAAQDLIGFLCNGAEFSEDAVYQTLEDGVIEYDWQKSLVQKLARLNEAAK